VTRLPFNKRKSLHANCLKQQQPQNDVGLRLMKGLPENCRVKQLLVAATFGCRDMSVHARYPSCLL
jgi:hypothetical protein